MTRQGSDLVALANEMQSTADNLSPRLHVYPADVMLKWAAKLRKLARAKPIADLNEWIEREFSGHGLALRRKEDPIIEGEPLMSMAVAKELTRAAVAEFAARRDAQPVAWQKRPTFGELRLWTRCGDHAEDQEFWRKQGYEVRELYANPPAPPKEVLARVIDGEAWAAIEDGRDAMPGSLWHARRDLALSKAEAIRALL
jgi:hypothetical protein